MCGSTWTLTSCLSVNLWVLTTLAWFLDKEVRAKNGSSEYRMICRVNRWITPFGASLLFFPIKCRLPKDSCVAHAQFVLNLLRKRWTGRFTKNCRFWITYTKQLYLNATNNIRVSYVSHGPQYKATLRNVWFDVLSADRSLRVFEHHFCVACRRTRMWCCVWAWPLAHFRMHWYGKCYK